MQAPGCKVDLSDCKAYFKRYRICELHRGMPSVEVNGKVRFMRC